MENQNNEFWDCECEHNYIHKKTDTLKCSICGAVKEDQPDSMENEVDLFMNQFGSLIGN